MPRQNSIQYKNYMLLELMGKRSNPTLTPLGTYSQLNLLTDE